VEEYGPDIFRYVGERGKVEILLLCAKVDGKQIPGITLKHRSRTDVKDKNRKTTV
jgi:hypothetical protein